MATTSQQLRERIKEEYKKCAMDPTYFLTRYSYIQHPKRGRVLFDLYQYQKHTLDEFRNHRYNIVLKGRQIGISTLVAGYSLWLMLFHNDKKVLVIATKQETAKNLVTKVKFMHQNLPVWLRGTIVTDNKLSTIFSNGSEIKAVASSDDAGRSEALSLLIMDEAAFIDNADIIWGAAQATLSTGGDAILLSTPNGIGNLFHKMWQEAESKQNDFNPILLDWRVHPERDQAWRDQQTRMLGEVMASQEHDASFIFSGNTVIPPEIIEFYKANYQKDPIAKEGFDGNLWIWEYPMPGRSYIVCADVSRGDGEDSSTYHVVDVEASRQVAEYKGKVETKAFGDMLVYISTYYNDALLIPDNSSIGWNSIQQIIDRGYKNLFYMSRDLQYVDVEHQMTGHYRKEERGMVPGFMISQRTRPLIISRLKEYMLESTSIIIQSSRTIAEFETFIWKNGRPEALSGYNDDLVMALAIGLWVRDTALRLRQEGIDITKRALEFTRYNEVPITSVMTNRPKENPYEMKIGQNTENLLWLL